MADELIAGEKIRVERKSFFVDLKRNHQGYFFKITEDVNGRRDTIILPSTGVNDFLRVMNELTQMLPPESLEPEAPRQDDTYYEGPDQASVGMPNHPY
jgi:hypothetical protein